MISRDQAESYRLTMELMGISFDPMNNMLVHISKAKATSSAWKEDYQWAKDQGWDDDDARAFANAGGAKAQRRNNGQNQGNRKNRGSK